MHTDRPVKNTLPLLASDFTRNRKKEIGAICTPLHVHESVNSTTLRQEQHTDTEEGFVITQGLVTFKKSPYVHFHCLKIQTCFFLLKENSCFLKNFMKLPIASQSSP